MASSEGELAMCLIVFATRYFARRRSVNEAVAHSLRRRVPQHFIVTELLHQIGN
jgi:hypothetical protein